MRFPDPSELLLGTDVFPRTNAPWGLARLSQAAKLTDQNTNDLTFTYKYDSTAGAGVDIYVVGGFTVHQKYGRFLLTAHLPDTGIFTSHVGIF